VSPRRALVAAFVASAALSTSSAQDPAPVDGPAALPLSSPVDPGPPATVVPTGILAPEAEEAVSRSFLTTMELIYAGRIAPARQLVDRLLEVAPEDPRPYLLRARVMREYVSEQDNTRENVKPQVAPILDVLRTAEKKSQAILDRDPESLAGLLYRGWSRMFRAQLHELAFEHWSAGRAAKSGKGDLDRVLRRDPENPDALMIVGTYLYFADLLPGVLKVAGFVLRIPPGDRDRGLEFLRLAEERPSFSQHDAKGMRGAILFGFEGDLEAARSLFDDFDARFPDNPRLVEPLAVVDLWSAERLGSGLPRIARVVEANASSPDPLARELTARLRLYQAWMEILSGRAEDGRRNLERLRAEGLDRPDWFRPIVHLYLADAHLLFGDVERARAILGDAEDGRDPTLAEMLRRIGEPDAAASPAEVERLERLQPVAAALYAGRLDEAEAGLESLPEDDAMVAFYAAELRQLRGDDEGALARFERLRAPDVPARCRIFRRVARLRIAEIHARSGQWEKAARTFDDEIERYDVKDMLRHVVRARQRYFVREAQPRG
jgi:tetratricopeptide (TPR) repeat protein